MKAIEADRKILTAEVAEKDRRERRIQETLPWEMLLAIFARDRRETEFESNRGFCDGIHTWAK
jgi:hypothetical protein